MLNHDTLLRAGTTVCIATVVLCTLSACGQQARSITGHAVAAPSMPNVPGCSEVTLTLEPGNLVANGAVNEPTPSALVNYVNVGAGSHIGLSGDNSCLWISGNVGPNVAISVSGHGSGVIIKGTVDPSVRIDVGPGSITWIPSVLSPSAPDAPDLRISDDDGGRLIVNGMETIEP